MNDRIRFGVSGVAAVVGVALVSWWSREFFDVARENREGALIGAPFITWSVMGLVIGTMAVLARLAAWRCVLLCLFCSLVAFGALTTGGGLHLNRSLAVLILGTVWTSLSAGMVIVCGAGLRRLATDAAGER